MSNTHRPPPTAAVAAFKRAATLLLKDLRSADPGRATAAATRCVCLPWVQPPRTAAHVLAMRDQVRRHHVLDVVAIEAGAKNWRDLVREEDGVSAATPDAPPLDDQLPDTQGPDERASRVNHRLVLSGLLPWSVAEFGIGGILFHEYGGWGNPSALGSVATVLEQRYANLHRSATEGAAHAHRFRMIMLWIAFHSDRLRDDNVLPQRRGPAAERAAGRLNEILATEPFLDAVPPEAGGTDLRWPNYSRVVARFRGVPVPNAYNMRRIAEDRGHEFLVSDFRGPGHVVLARQRDGQIRAELYIDGRAGGPAAYGVFGAGWADEDARATLLRTLLDQVPMAVLVDRTFLFNMHGVTEQEWTHRDFECAVYRDRKTAGRAIGVHRFSERPPLAQFHRPMPGASLDEAIGAATAWADVSADARERAAARTPALRARMAAAPSGAPCVGDPGVLIAPFVPLPKGLSPEVQAMFGGSGSSLVPRIRLHAEVLALHGPSTGAAAAHGPWGVTVESEKGVLTTSATWNADAMEWVFADV